MKYKIESFPKNKEVDFFKLNEYQIVIRNNQQKYYYGKEFTCSKCLKKQPIKEFYIADKNTERRKKSCRDCQMKEGGVVEIGKNRFASKIANKGFRRCSVCKDIKPLTEFSKQKNNYLERASNCKECNAKAVKKLQVKGKQQLTDWYVREYGKRKGITDFNENVLNELRNEIIEKQKPKFFVDGLEFKTLKDFSKYIKSKYGIPSTTTEKRIANGKSEEDCKISNFEARSLSYSKGKIQVIDTVTNEVFYFNNTKDSELLKMFSTSAITKCIKYGKPTKITSLSKYKNPCIIKRLK